jgi:hypothetical protein
MTENTLPGSASADVDTGETHIFVRSAGCHTRSHATPIGGTDSFVAYVLST